MKYLKYVIENIISLQDQYFTVLELNRKWSQICN